MRIIIANWHRQIVGGVETYLQTLIPSLANCGHQVSLLYGNAALPNQTTIDDPDANMTVWSIGESDSRRTLESVASWKPDLVFVHGLNSTELEAALLDRYPAVLFAHNYYGTCATGRKCYSRGNVTQCSRTFGPMCMALHFPRRCGGLNPISMWNGYQSQSKRNAFIFRYRSLIVASNHMHAEYARHGISQDRLHLVPLPTTRINPDAQPPSPREIMGRILFVGRLTDIKGADYLLNALARASQDLVRPLTLTVLGDGPERDRLEDLGLKLGLSVEFVGQVDSEQRNLFLRDSDLLVIPSVWPEPFGLVGIEAGCVGLPSVGYAVGGIPDWLIPGKSGELAPGDPPTVRGLAEAIVRALRNPDHHHKLRCGAWEIANRHTMGAHLKILEPILSRTAFAEVAQPYKVSNVTRPASPAKMDFLFVSSFACDANTGAAGSLLAIGSALSERGHQVDYLWNPGEPSTVLHPSLDRLFRLPRQQYKQVADRLRHSQYDVVIVSQPYAFLVYERLVAKYPDTLFLNRTHGWEDRVSQSNRQLRWDIKSNWFSGAMAQISAAILKQWCVRTARASHGLISPGHHCATFIVKSYETAPGRVATIGYGLEDEYLQNQYAEKSGNGRMLFVGQYHPIKGIKILESLLPSLAKQYVDAKLTFVVEKEAVGRVRAHFGPAFGDRLSVHSWMERSKLIEIYNRHEIFLYSSFFEGFGKTVLEAMACGMCVVGFDEGGLSDLATNGQEALFCEVGDSLSFRRLLEQCLRDPLLTRAIGRRARIVAQRYPWSRTAEETERFCRELRTYFLKDRNGLEARYKSLVPAQ